MWCAEGVSRFRNEPTPYTVNLHRMLCTSSALRVRPAWGLPCSDMWQRYRQSKPWIRGTALDMFSPGTAALDLQQRPKIFLLRRSIHRPTNLTFDTLEDLAIFYLGHMTHWLLDCFNRRHKCERRTDGVVIKQDKKAVLSQRWTRNAPMRPIHGCPEIFGTSWLRPSLLFPTFFMGFCSDRPYKCSHKIWSR